MQAMGMKECFWSYYTRYNNNDNLLMFSIIVILEESQWGVGGSHLIPLLVNYIKHVF